MRIKHIPLLPRIIIAIILGIIFGLFLPMSVVRFFVTFNNVFSQFLGFMIPFIIVALITSAIGNIGKNAGKLLLATVIIAYIDTVIAGILAYGTGISLFPTLIEAAKSASSIGCPDTIQPFFTVNIPPMFDVMSALIFAFMMGLCIAYGSFSTVHNVFNELKEIISRVISRAIVPLLPLYIFGIFLSMTNTGQVYGILKVFSLIIIIIFLLHLFIIFYEFIIAGLLNRKNPFKALYNMLPAYFTALGTSSSAATIPVTLQQTLKNGVSESIAGFTIPLCATIHMSGSAMKITCCAITICLINGLDITFITFLHFIMMLAIVMVAAPGVPGGAIMAALAPLSTILGFDSESQALMIALYIAMDSFGTACNVTGDGAIAMIINYFIKKEEVS